MLNTKSLFKFSNIFYKCKIFLHIAYKNATIFDI